MPVSNDETKLFIPCGCVSNCTILAINHYYDALIFTDDEIRPLREWIDARLPHE